MRIAEMFQRKTGTADPNTSPLQKAHMHTTLNRILLILFLLLSAIPSIDSQTLSVDRRNVGLVVDNKSTRPVGLGFLMESNRRVWTCGVLPATGDYAYVPIGQSLDSKVPMPVRYSLKLEGSSTNAGISVLSTDTDVVQTPLKRASFRTMKSGDSIWYLKEIQARPADFASASISSLGVTSRSDGTKANYFEAESAPFLGHICGPVLNADGSVVAFIGEVWLRINPTTGTPVSFLRAFEVATLDEVVQKKK
jgi:hypothetical protein